MEKFTLADAFLDHRNIRSFDAVRWFAAFAARLLVFGQYDLSFLTLDDAVLTGESSARLLGGRRGDLS
jgi:hypothetical protein